MKPALITVFSGRSDPAANACAIVSFSLPKRLVKNGQGKAQRRRQCPLHGKALQRRHGHF
jgi:hypothetical protein